MHDSQWCAYLYAAYYKFFHEVSSPVGSEAGADSSWLVGADWGGGGGRGKRGGQKGKKKKHRKTKQVRWT